MHHKSSAKICEVNHYQQEEQVAHAQAYLTWRKKKWNKESLRSLPLSWDEVMVP